MSATSRRAVLAVLTAVFGLGLAAPPSEAQEGDVPYVPTPLDVVRQMLRMAEVGPADTVYDLGSGDGRIVVTAAREFGARGVGVEIDPELVEEARENARQEGVEDRVRIVRGDLFETDVSPATAVTLYLLQSVNLKLRAPLLDQLRPGTPVVSHDFTMGEWEPDTVVHMSEHTADVYRWTVPADVSGRWRLIGPQGGSWELRIRQRFQQIRGTARSGDSEVELADARLHGDSVRFTLPGAEEGSGPLRLRGRAQGDAMEGVASSGGGWSATRTEKGEPWPEESPWPSFGEQQGIGDIEVELSPADTSGG